jgi:hypothetical protein
MFRYINGLLTRVELRQNCGIDLTLTGYANFGRAVTQFVNRLSINRLNDGSTVSLNKKKLCSENSNHLITQQTVKTFFRITGIQYVGNDLFSKIISVWNEPGLQTDKVLPF